MSKIDIHVYNFLFITLWANSERCESAKIVLITNIKIVKNFFLVIKTTIINTQILHVQLNDTLVIFHYVLLTLFLIKILPFTDYSKPDQRTSLWQNIRLSTHDWTSHWTTLYHKAAGNQSTLETGEWPTEDVPSDDSTEPYKVGPIDMVQRLCIVMLPRVPSKFHQKLALRERVQLYKRWTIIYQPKLTKGHQVSEFLLLIL